MYSPSILITHPDQQLQPPQADPTETRDYAKFFGCVANTAHNTRTISRQLFASYNIRLTSEHSAQSSAALYYTSTRTVLISVERGASIITYDVLLGAYIVRVRMLNIDDRIFTSNDPSLGKGGYGSIIPLADQNEEFVAKRIKFRERLQLMKQSTHGRQWSIDARFSEVQQVIKEYAMAKVCSMLGISPRLKTDVGFDLICYRDCIEFYMERCWSFHQAVPNMGFQERLKYCVAVMHQHRMIHRDVKPANVVWSSSLDDFVLCDFGVSCTVLERAGFKTLTQSEGTEKYMTAELKCMTDKGFVDLYFADKYALSMCIEELEKFYGDSPKRTSRVRTDTTYKKPPTPRIMFLKTLSCLIQGSPPPEKAPPNKSLLKQTFQDLTTLADTKALRFSPKVQFLLSSMDISFDIRHYLQKADQKDPRVQFIFQRVKTMLNKSNLATQKYQNVVELGKYAPLLRLHYTHEIELERLKNSLVRSPKDEIRYWQLMEYFLKNHASKAVLPSAKNEDLLEEFKKKQVLPNQRKTQLQVSILRKLGVTVDGKKLEVTKEQYDELASSTEFIGKALDCYSVRGDFRGGFDAILRFGQSPAITSYGWLFQNLHTFYLGLRDKSFLSPAEVRQKFSEFKEDQNDWHWLKHLHLLALSLLHTDYAECVKVCNQYMARLNDYNKSTLMFIAVSAYEGLELLQMAIECQQRLINIVKTTRKKEIYSLASLEQKLLQLQSQQPGVDIEDVVQRTWRLLAVQRQMYHNNHLILRLQKFLSELLVRQQKYQEASEILSEEMEAEINKFHGAWWSVHTFHIQKLSLFVEQFRKEADQRKKTFMVYRITTLVDKLKPLIPKLTESNVLLLALCYANVHIKHFAQVQEWLRQLIHNGLQEEDSFQRVFWISRNVIDWLLSQDRLEDARNLLRFITQNLLSTSDNNSNLNRCLINKLVLVLECGLLMGIEKQLREQLYSNTLSKVGELTIQCTQHLHRTAIHLMELGLHKDALMLFEKAQPTSADIDAALACAISNYYAGSAQFATKLLLSIEDGQFGQKQLAQCWKLLSLTLVHHNDLARKELYLEKAFEAYSALWVQSVRYFMRARKESTVAKLQPTYSNELLQIHKRMKVTNSLSRKQFANKLLRHDIFHFSLLGDFTKLCRTYIFLRKRRQFIKAYASIQKSNHHTKRDDCRKMLETMDREGQWVEQLALSGEMPKKCKDELSLTLLSKLSMCELPDFKKVAELVTGLVSSKRLLLTLLTLKKLKAVMTPSRETLLKSAIQYVEVLSLQRRYKAKK